MAQRLRKGRLFHQRAVERHKFPEEPAIRRGTQAIPKAWKSARGSKSFRAFIISGGRWKALRVFEAAGSGDSENRPPRVRREDFAGCERRSLCDAFAFFARCGRRERHRHASGLEGSAPPSSSSSEICWSRASAFLRARGRWASRRRASSSSRSRRMSW